MNNTTLSLSDLFFPISTYHGNLCFDDNDKAEFDDFEKQNGKLTEKQKNDFYDSFDFEKFKKDFIKEFKKDIFENKKIIQAYKKYGVIFKEFSFFSPKYYNYINDSVDVEFNCKKDCRKDLEKEINIHIKNELTKSYDGYLSLKDDTFEKTELDSYAVLWSIAKKENIIKEIEKLFENIIEKASEIHSNNAKYQLNKYYKII